jgi:hypothetical protein
MGAGLRQVLAVGGLALICGLGLALSPASAQTASSSSAAQAGNAAPVQDLSAQSRRRTVRRAPHRVRIYAPRLGPNSVRVCNAYYEQEYRPSGTVIVPRMQCAWRG